MKRKKSETMQWSDARKYLNYLEWSVQADCGGQFPGLENQTLFLDIWAKAIESARANGVYLGDDLDQSYDALLLDLAEALYGVSDHPYVEFIVAHNRAMPAYRQASFQRQAGAARESFEAQADVAQNPECPICLDQCFFYPPELRPPNYYLVGCSAPTRRCEAFVYHEACSQQASPTGVCLNCNVANLSRLESLSLEDRVPSYSTRDWEIPAVSSIGPEYQEGMLCYAAAAATAYRWGLGLDVSAYDMMHRFLMSDGAGAAGDPAVANYQEAVRQLPGCEGMSTAEILSLVPEEVVRAAVGHLGSPILDEDVSHITDLSDSDIQFHLGINRPIIAGQGMHWVVIYGYSLVGPQIVTISVFDPKLGYRKVNWPEKYSIGYAIGY